MLPTEKASSLVLGLDNILEYDDVLRTYGGGVFQQHLYIISDDKIKEGDWLLFIPDESISKCDKEDFKALQEMSILEASNWKKIVATTDKSLHPESANENVNNWGKVMLPKLPESFIQAYIKAHNEGRTITEVDLDVEETTKFKKPLASVYNSTRAILNNLDTTYTIKTRPDNTVIILPIIIPTIPPKQDKLYTKDEVEKIIRETCKNAHKFIHNYEQSENTINKWIKDNL